MTQRTMFTQEQVIALLLSDQSYWAEVQAIQAAWDLPSAGFPTWTLTTYWDERSVAPLTQWETTWHKRAAIRPLNEIDRHVAQINRQHGLPPILDRWVMQYIKYGHRQMTRYTQVTFESEAGQESSVARGVGVYTDAGELRQVDWKAQFPFVDSSYRSLDYARLVSFGFAPHDGTAYKAARDWIAPRDSKAGYLPLEWHCTGTLMHQGIVYQVQCCIELSRAVNAALFQDAQLDFELVQPVKPAVGVCTQLPAHPQIDAPRDDWFRWFHYATDELGFKVSLKDLANLMGLSHSRVRHLHAEYQAEHKQALE